MYLIQIVVNRSDAPSKSACHSERSVSGVEESMHFRDICSKISAKILRLPSVAQDDTLFLLLFKLEFVGVIEIGMKIPEILCNYA